MTLCTGFKKKQHSASDNIKSAQIKIIYVKTILKIFTKEQVVTK